MTETSEALGTCIAHGAENALLDSAAALRPVQFNSI